MDRFFCANINTTEPSYLDEQESHHCTRVLRHQVGDEVILFDGKGTIGYARIDEAGKKQVKLTVSTTEHIEPDPYFLHVAIAPTKSNDRMEWFIEKSVEFGIHQISFLKTEHSERRQINLSRFEKIVLSAAKQSQSAYLPQLSDLITFNQFIDQKFSEQNQLIATLHEKAEVIQFNLLKNQSTIVIIGPEGGFSETEVNKAITKGIKPTSLGNKRLRTETAGVFFPSSLYAVHLNK